MPCKRLRQNRGYSLLRFGCSLFGCIELLTLLHSILSVSASWLADSDQNCVRWGTVKLCSLTHCCRWTERCRSVQRCVFSCRHPSVNVRQRLRRLRSSCYPGSPTPDHRLRLDVDQCSGDREASSSLAVDAIGRRRRWSTFWRSFEVATDRWSHRDTGLSFLAERNGPWWQLTNKPPKTSRVSLRIARFSVIQIQEAKRLRLYMVVKKVALTVYICDVQ